MTQVNTNPLCTSPCNYCHSTNFYSAYHTLKNMPFHCQPPCGSSLKGGNNLSLIRLPRLYSAMLNNKGLHSFYPGVTKNSKGKKVVISEILDLKYGCKYSHNLVSHGLSSKSQLFSEPPESAQCCVLSPAPCNKDKPARRSHHDPSDTEMQSQIIYHNLNSAAFPGHSFRQFTPLPHSSEDYSFGDDFF